MDQVDTDTQLLARQTRVQQLAEVVEHCKEGRRRSRQSRMSTMATATQGASRAVDSTAPPYHAHSMDCCSPARSMLCHGGARDPRNALARCNCLSRCRCVRRGGAVGPGRVTSALLAASRCECGRRVGRGRSRPLSLPLTPVQQHQPPCCPCRTCSRDSACILLDDEWGGRWRGGALETSRPRALGALFSASYRVHLLPACPGPIWHETDASSACARATAQHRRTFSTDHMLLLLQYSLCMHTQHGEDGCRSCTAS